MEDQHDLLENHDLRQLWTRFEGLVGHQLCRLRLDDQPEPPLSPGASVSSGAVLDACSSSPRSLLANEVSSVSQISSPARLQAGGPRSLPDHSNGSDSCLGKDSSDNDDFRDVGGGCGGGECSSGGKDAVHDEPGVVSYNSCYMTGRETSDELVPTDSKKKIRDNASSNALNKLEPQHLFGVYKQSLLLESQLHQYLNPGLVTSLNRRVAKATFEAEAMINLIDKLKKESKKSVVNAERRQVVAEVSTKIKSLLGRQKCEWQCVGRLKETLTMAREMKELLRFIARLSNTLERSKTGLGGAQEKPPPYEYCSPYANLQKTVESADELPNQVMLCSSTNRSPNNPGKVGTISLSAFPLGSSTESIATKKLNRSTASDPGPKGPTIAQYKPIQDRVRLNKAQRLSRGLPPRERSKSFDTESYSECPSDLGSSYMGRSSARRPLQDSNESRSFVLDSVTSLLSDSMCTQPCQQDSWSLKRRNRGHSQDSTCESSQDQQTGSFSRQKTCITSPPRAEPKCELRRSRCENKRFPGAFQRGDQHCVVEKKLIPAGAPPPRQHRRWDRSPTARNSRISDIEGPQITSSSFTKYSTSGNLSQTDREASNISYSSVTGKKKSSAKGGGSGRSSAAASPSLKGKARSGTSSKASVSSKSKITDKDAGSGKRSKGKDGDDSPGDSMKEPLLSGSCSEGSGSSENSDSILIDITSDYPPPKAGSPCCPSQCFGNRHIRVKVSKRGSTSSSMSKKCLEGKSPKQGSQVEEKSVVREESETEPTASEPREKADGQSESLHQSETKPESVEEERLVEGRQDSNPRISQSPLPADETYAETFQDAVEARPESPGQRTPPDTLPPSSPGPRTTAGTRPPSDHQTPSGTVPASGQNTPAGTVQASGQNTPAGTLQASGQKTSASTLPRSQSGQKTPTSTLPRSQSGQQSASTPVPHSDEEEQHHSRSDSFHSAMESYLPAYVRDEPWKLFLLTLLLLSLLYFLFSSLFRSCCGCAYIPNPFFYFTNSLAGRVTLRHNGLPPI